MGFDKLDQSRRVQAARRLVRHVGMVSKWTKIVAHGNNKKTCAALWHKPLGVKQEGIDRYPASRSCSMQIRKSMPLREWIMPTTFSSKTNGGLRDFISRRIAVNLRYADDSVPGSRPR